MRRWLLESDDEHPVRPNLPFLRHLTYDEIHAFQLGIVGLPIGAAYAEGLVELSVWFTVAIMGIVFGISKYEDTENGKRRAMGVISDVPWYFTTSYFTWAMAGVYLSATLFPPPTLPDAISGGTLASVGAVVAAIIALLRDTKL